MPPTSSSTPKNVAAGVVKGCTSFYTRESSLLCFQIADTFGISVENFEAWNGGSKVCDVLENGRAYCVAAKSSNVARANPTRTFYFTEIIFYHQIAANAEFKAQNGSNVYNDFQSRLAHLTTHMTRAPTVSTVTIGVVQGCPNLFKEMTLLCYDIVTNDAMYRGGLALRAVTIDSYIFSIMRSSRFLGFALATNLPFIRAVVYPDFPAGDLQTAGKTCHITWQKDQANSPTAWKDMTIQFMTGDNFNMVHLTSL
ncbi:hypothetical protein H0H87_010589 [Tephrocybe sp. NHM501043]|nr:hypothetical protein H0H87_010589 [Tephrocybe sp. NHM501043]